MKIEKAELEIKKLLDCGLYFKYIFDYNCTNKINIPIKEYSISNIISKLKQDEKISFMINDGYVWNENHDVFKLIYNEKYADSIYWKHIFYGDFVRVDSDMESIRNWMISIYEEY